MPRRARRPVAALSGLALVPALALGGVVLIARGESQPSATTTTSSVAQERPDALATPLLSVRRAPTPLAADRTADVVAAAATPLAEALDATSCLSLSLNDRLVVERNSDVVLIPASNVKVVTAAVALDVLGAGTTFTTTVVGPAPVDGVIEGDIHVVGGGDPVLSERWYAQPAEGRQRPPLHVTDVNLLADALVAAGVTRVNGAVLADDSRYDDERFPAGWNDEIRRSADGAPVGALVINDSFLSSGARGDNPTDSAARTFLGLLAERGIEVTGGFGSAVAPAGAAVLGSIASAPLSTLLNEMLATSDNLTAEMLLKEIGLATTQQGTRAAGLQAMAERVASWGVPMAGVTFTDGSGLSRDNSLTCAALAAVLQRGSAADPVGAGLAIAGQDGSTLADSFQQQGLEGVVQGKTGTLTGVKSLSGYFVSGTDEVAFVLILNGDSAPLFQPLWDQLGSALLTVTTGPAASALGPTAS